MVYLKIEVTYFLPEESVSFARCIVNRFFVFCIRLLNVIKTFQRDIFFSLFLLSHCLIVCFLPFDDDGDKNATNLMPHVGKMHVFDHFSMLMAWDWGSPTDYDNERGKYDLSWLITTPRKWSMKLEQLEDEFITSLYLSVPTNGYIHCYKTLKIPIFIRYFLWHIGINSHDIQSR